MEPFPHLNFIKKLSGRPRFFGGGGNERTKYNKEHRKEHSSNLSKQTNILRSQWLGDFEKREKEGKAPIEEEVVPVFLHINPALLGDMEFSLHKFGIEIISEEEDGFIIGASTDNLRSLQNKIEGFMIKSHNTAKIADLWEIIEGNRDSWRIEHILSEQLLKDWSSLSDEDLYEVEVSIAFDKPSQKPPSPGIRGYEKKLQEYRDSLVERDDLLIERENHFQKFISHYGEISSDLVHLEDSFGCKVEISGKGLKDLVLNYQYVFEVSEIQSVKGVEGAELEEISLEFEVIPPDKDSPEIGVVDSGIMEEHKYLKPAINSDKSKSYVKEDTSTADHVPGGGHGTKVAGAILYPEGISHLEPPYKLPFFLRNLRVLNSRNVLENFYPAELMMKIVEENPDCLLFNLSVNSDCPHRKKHMSTWAAAIDFLTHKNDLLFIVSAGNLHKRVIQRLLQNGNDYPGYLEQPDCGIANPAQSSFALCVGSINHDVFKDDYFESLGGKDEISAFSRIGTGIWGKIKPDVVEYGGGLVRANNGLNTVNQKIVTSPELIRSTLDGGSAFGKDSVGTSFAAPKVANIVASLKKIYPEENANLLRALVAQGARLPEQHFESPNELSIRYFGYGIPKLERVSKNTETRITFYNTNLIRAEEGHLYSIKIPEELRNPSDEFQVLIEVTLAYTAKVRRTRQKTRSYLGTWLDWTTSKVDESFEEFQEYALSLIEGRRMNMIKMKEIRKLLLGGK